MIPTLVWFGPTIRSSLGWGKLKWRLMAYELEHTTYGYECINGTERQYSHVTLGRSFASPSVRHRLKIPKHISHSKPLHLHPMPY